MDGMELVKQVESGMCPLSMRRTHKMETTVVEDDPSPNLTI